MHPLPHAMAVFDTPPPRRRVARRALVIAVLGLLPCLAVQAQVVRKCRVAGQLVLQEAPCRAGQTEAVVLRAGATPATAAPRRIELAVNNTAAATPAPKKSLAELLRARDAGRAPRPAPVSDEPPADGAMVLRSRMGAV